MRFLKFALPFVLAATAVNAAPIEIPGVDNVIDLLDPRNFDLVKFTEAAIAFIASPIVGKVPMNFLGVVLPKPSIELNLELLAPLKKVEMPNYGEEFHVKGVEEYRTAWLVEAEDRTEDDPVILYIHGGGYVFGLFPMMVNVWITVYKMLGNDRLSVLLLDYTVATDAQYPQLMIEVVKTFNKLTETSNNVYLAGDSAGGHLVLSLLRHQNYEPYLGVPDASTSQANGAILLSPWVNLYPEDDEGSYETNLGKDILNAKILRHFTEEYLPSDAFYDLPEFNQYKDCIDWKSILPANVFVSKGENEVLHDDITTWTELAGLSDAQVYEDPDGIHDGAIFTPVKSNDIIEKLVVAMKSWGL